MTNKYLTLLVLLNLIIEWVLKINLAGEWGYVQRKIIKWRKNVSWRLEWTNGMSEF